MRGFIFANALMFDVEKAQKRGKTNKIDTFQFGDVKIVNEKNNAWIYFCKLVKNEAFWKDLFLRI